ncbi:cytochrome C [Myxococcaceae bacterium GXIMD 01537]
MQRFRHRLQAASVCALLALGALAGCGSSNSNDGVNPNQIYTTQDPNERERIEKGIQISPLAVNLDGKDRDLVGLGSYIVNAQGGCNECHTNPPYAPGGDPFKGEPKQVNTAGFLEGGMAFGPIVSPSIRPDAAGNPAGLSRDEFIAILRTGNANGRLLQIMPWPVFQGMTDRDLGAIYEYLRSLPPRD